MKPYVVIIVTFITLFWGCRNSKNNKDIEVNEQTLEPLVDVVEEGNSDIYSEIVYDGPTCLEDIKIDNESTDFRLDPIEDNSYIDTVVDISLRDEEVTLDTTFSDISSDFSIDTGVFSCPIDMVLIDLGGYKFCMDIYEASRPDATSTSGGSNNSYATSRQGVIPWFSVDIGTARTACNAAGKRLCYDYEWTQACKGPDNTIYSYGNSYDPIACNGIDTFCQNPSPGCYWNEQNVPFHVMPTGSFPNCTNEYGVYDINGNVWEWVEDSLGGHPRGGAYNCGDSATLHQCEYIPQFTPSARGFRCCKDVSTGN